jgi:hypothetical protein
MPTTGSPTTEVIGQAEQFALSVVQSRPTQCRHTCICAPTRAWELEGLSHRSASESDAAPYSLRLTPTPRFAN